MIWAKEETLPREEIETDTAYKAEGYGSIYL